MISALIIDDELDAKLALEFLIKHHGFNKIKCIGYADSVTSGIEAINTLKPDLVFLDVQIIGGYGFDILKSFEEINFEVIFATAYDQYAVDAFKYTAIDYLLKPIDKNEFERAVMKVINKSGSNNVPNQTDALINYFNQKDYIHKKITIRCTKDIYVIDIDNIVCVKSDKNYSEFHLTDGKMIVASKPLKHYYEKLQDFGFFKVHQSHIISLNKIKAYRKEDYTLIMSDGSSIPVSYRKRDDLLKMFDEF